MITDTFKLEFWDNDDFSIERSKDTNNGFLYYPYYMDVEPAEPIAESDYIRDIGKLLTALRSHGCKAVAACDFEDQLPPG